MPERCLHLGSVVARSGKDKHHDAPQARVRYDLTVTTYWNVAVIVGCLNEGLKAQKPVLGVASGIPLPLEPAHHHTRELVVDLEVVQMATLYSLSWVPGEVALHFPVQVV